MTGIYLFAHPHVFIDIGVVIKGLKDVRISWTFDPIESQNKIYFFDDDGDGLLNRAEIETLYLEGFKSIKDYNYFINIASGGRQYPVKEIYNFDAIIEEDRRLTVSFNIKLPELSKDDNKISITHFDTSYFIAFSEPDNSSIKLEAPLYSAVLTNTTKPFYYDPEAGRGEEINTSKPKKGWLMVYPTEVFISTEPIIDSFDDYKIGFRERLIQIQRVVYIKLSENLINIKDGKSKGIIYILFFAFIYGVVHAVGPGHRKIVISSYILSRDKISYFKAVGISLTSALVHSGTGIFTIILLSIIFKKVKPAFIDNITGSIEIISYIGVLVLALVLIFLKLIHINKKKKNNDRPLALSLIILSSLIPCPGAITIMLFSLSLNILSLGIVTVLSMSMGIGLTLTLISIITLKGKTIIKNVSSGKFKFVSSIIEWGGLIILLLFSIFMIFAIY